MKIKNIFNYRKLWKHQKNRNKLLVKKINKMETSIAEDLRLDITNDEIRKLKQQVNALKNQVKKLNLEAQKDKETQQKEFILYLENEIYSIEPKGTGINYNCEYDSEEDYISAMKEQSKLNTLKEILSKFKEIIGDDK